jgi:hypothetical protein
LGGRFNQFLIQKCAEAFFLWLWYLGQLFAQLLRFSKIIDGNFPENRLTEIFTMHQTDRPALRRIGWGNQLMLYVD